MFSPSSSNSLIKSHNYHIRSVSLPSKSNPIIQKFEEELNKLKSWEEYYKYSSNSAATVDLETVTAGISGLVDLYKCVDDVLGLASTTKQAFIAHRDHLHDHDKKNINKEKYLLQLDRLLDGSLRLLDLSTSAMDLVVKLKESVRTLRSSLRRRRKKGSASTSSMEGIMVSHLGLRKEIIKTAKRGIFMLNRMDEDHVLFSRRFSFDDDDDDKDIKKDKNDESNLLNLNMVTKMLRCVTFINVSIYESLLQFLSVPVLCPKPARRSSKWSVVISKLMTRSRNNNELLGAREDIVNELKGVEACLKVLCSKKRAAATTDDDDDEEEEMFQVLECRLEGLENGFEELEVVLLALFRQLIKTRASLLNIISI